MSKSPFAESLSSDTFERAIARKVVRILNDPSLDRQQRKALIQSAQRQLLTHRQQQATQHSLQQQAAGLSLPKGARPQRIQVQDGQLCVAVVQPHRSYTWLEAGAAPQALAANRASLNLGKSTGQRRSGDAKDPLSSRRKELRLTSLPAPGARKAA